MFRKYYKQANDDIKTNRELIDQIFDKAAQNPKKGAMTKVYKFGLAAVAAVAVVVSAVMIMPFENGDTVDEINGTVAFVNESSDIRQESQVEKKDISNGNTEDSSLDKQQEKSDVKANNEKGVKASEEKHRNESESNKDNSVKEERKDETRNVDFIVPDVSERPKDNGAVLAAETDETTEETIVARDVVKAGNSEESSNATNVAKLEDFDDVSDAEANVISNMLISNFGEEDEITGNEYIFEIVGKSEEVYLGRWRWMVGDHSSLLTEFVISSNMSEMYECTYDDEGNIQWSKEENLLFD